MKEAAASPHLLGSFGDEAAREHDSMLNGAVLTCIYQITFTATLTDLEDNIISTEQSLRCQTVHQCIIVPASFH